MKEPTSAEEYEKRYSENVRIEGKGTDTRTVFPCPFCAAPDFMEWNILDVSDDQYRERTCSACGRGAKYQVVYGPNSIELELVQTTGKEAPPWVTMRRLQ